MTLISLRHIFSHEIFVTVSISLLVIDLFKLFLSSWFNFGMSYIFKKFHHFFYVFQFNGVYILKVYNHDFLNVIGICYNVSSFISNFIDLSLLSLTFGWFG